jgi:hypothetical protein
VPLLVHTALLKGIDMTVKTFKRNRTDAADSLSKLASLVGFCTGNFADPKTRQEEIKKFEKAEKQRDHLARVRVNAWRDSQ